MRDESITPFEQLRVRVLEAKSCIFDAQDGADVATEQGMDLDGVRYSLTAIRSALEQLDNTLEGIQDAHRPPGSRPPVTRVRSSETKFSL